MICGTPSRQKWAVPAKSRPNGLNQHCSGTDSWTDALTIAGRWKLNRGRLQLNVASADDVRAVKRPRLNNRRVKRDTDRATRHSVKPLILLLTPAA